VSGGSEESVQEVGVIQDQCHKEKQNQNRHKRQLHSILQAETIYCFSTFMLKPATQWHNTPKINLITLLGI